MMTTVRSCPIWRIGLRWRHPVGTTGTCNRLARKKLLACTLRCAKVSVMHMQREHIDTNETSVLLTENPMSRRNDAYTAIYYYRYC